MKIETKNRFMKLLKSVKRFRCRPKKSINRLSKQNIFFLIFLVCVSIFNVAKWIFTALYCNNVLIAYTCVQCSYSTIIFQSMFHLITLIEMHTAYLFRFFHFRNKNYDFLSIRCRKFIACGWRSAIKISWLVDFVEKSLHFH